MTESSKLCALVSKAVSLLKNAFKESKIYAFLVRTVCFFADAYTDSATRKVLVGKGDIERFADSSLLYKALGKVFGGVLSFFTGICQTLEKSIDSSVCKKIYFAFFKKSFRDNYVSFTAFLCTFIFVVPHNFWSNTFGLLFAGAGVIFYVIAAAGKDASKVPGKHFSGVWLAFIMFCFCLAVSCITSYDRAESIRIMMFFITSVLMCLLVYASVRDKDGLMTIGAFMYAVLLFTSVVAVFQRVVGVEADASLTDLSLNKNMPGRVFSTLGNPNNYAEFLVLFMPFAFAFALNMKKQNKKGNLLVLGMLLPAAAILLTYSRSGWIAFAIAAIVFVVLYDKKLIPVFVIAVLFAIPFIPENILNRILTIGNMKDSSSSYRMDIWAGSLDMLKDYWFTGVGLGPGGFAKIYPNYVVGDSGAAMHSHMHFMEMMVELGVLGFISYISLTFSLIRRSFVASAKKVPYEIRNFAIASAASMTGIVMIGCFEYVWFYPRVMFAFFICAGLCMAVYRMAKKEIK